MESRFGYDFSRVRVHSGPAAEESAREIDAAAYTVRENIVFGAGQFAPHNSNGRGLLAHELAHVVQQGRANSGLGLADCEQDAENAARAVGSGNAPVVRASAVFGSVQRKPATTTRKKSRLVRIERYWGSPAARAFFEDGTNEEVTFIDASRLDPASRPDGEFERKVDLTIDRSSPIRPHVEFASHSSGSKVKVVTRLSPADRISKLPGRVRGELSQAFLGDAEDTPDPGTMEFIADMGDRLSETGGTTKIELEGQDPATVTRMKTVDLWVGEQQKTLDKLGSLHRARFTQLLSDIRKVGVTGPTQAEDLDVQEIELVLAGAAGGQSEFQTFDSFKRSMQWRLRSGNMSLPAEAADNPEFFIRNEYRKAWKAEAAGLRKMSRIADAAVAAPFLALGASAAVGTGGALFEVFAVPALDAAGTKFVSWAAARGVSTRLLAKYVGTSLFASSAVQHFASARDEADAAGMDPNSPSGVATTLSAAILRAAGIGEVAESVTDKSLVTRGDLNRTASERILGGVLGTANALGTFSTFAPEAPGVRPPVAARPPAGSPKLPGAVLAWRLKIAQIMQGAEDARANVGLNSPTSSLVETATADSAAGKVGSTAGDAAIRPDPGVRPDLPTKAPQPAPAATSSASSGGANVSTASPVPDPLAGAVPRRVDVTGGGAFTGATEAESRAAQLRAALAQAEQRFARLQQKAAQAEKAYANRLRNRASAMERRGVSPTPREQDLLATKKSLEAAREDARFKRDQLKAELQAAEPKTNAHQRSREGFAQEPVYIEELRAREVAAEKMDANAPVIDAAVVGTEEVHSVKTLVPSKGSDAALRLARSGSPRDLASRISKMITKALRDRGSDKWSRLRNQWNTTKRATYADRFGYDLPKNPNEIRFVVNVRVMTDAALSAEAQQAVEKAVAEWLSKNERVPPGFSWRIDYVNGGGQ